MIIDSFLFFDEVDLLKLRLQYLDEYVDKFIIVEAKQTFSGLPKPLNFLKNYNQFSEYQRKIEYIQVEGGISSFEDIQNLLTENDVNSKKIFEFLNSHSHYSKSLLRWLLDSYHRECIHYGLQNVADTDICILSDLDEIPNLTKLRLNPDMQPTVCMQHMFSYYINYYQDSNWYGSIVAPAKWMKKKSLNSIRLEARNDNVRVFNYVGNAGFHFTSVGGVEQIRHKMESWAHQELNTFTNKYALNYNLKRGGDIFNRSTGSVFKSLELADERYGKKMTHLLSESSFPIGPQIREPRWIDPVCSNIFWATSKLESLFYRLKENIICR